MFLRFVSLSSLLLFFISCVPQWSDYSIIPKMRHISLLFRPCDQFSHIRQTYISNRPSTSQQNTNPRSTKSNFNISFSIFLVVRVLIDVWCCALSSSLLVNLFSRINSEILFFTKIVRLRTQRLIESIIRHPMPSVSRPIRLMTLDNRDYSTSNRRSCMRGASHPSNLVDPTTFSARIVSVRRCTWRSIWNRCDRTSRSNSDCCPYLNTSVSDRPKSDLYQRKIFDRRTSAFSRMMSTSALQ